MMIKNCFCVQIKYETCVTLAYRIEFNLDMTLKWHLLTSNDLQFYSECYNCVLRPRNRYETCATLIFLNVLKSQKLKKREFGGHLGNDVIK